MDARKKEIDQNEAEVSEFEHQITAECILIGKRIVELDRSPIRNQELLKYLNNIDSLRKSIDAYQRDVTHIQTTVRRMDEIRRQIQENQKRAKDLVRDREARFVEIGAGSYTVFKNLVADSGERAQYRPVFEEMLRLDAEMDRLQHELKDLIEQEKSKGFLEKWFKYKGKKFSVRSDINKIERGKIKAYTEAGQRIVESSFASLTNGDLRTLYDLDADRRSELERLTGEDLESKRELETLQAELHRYGTDAYAEEKVRELEKRIEDVQRELEVMFCWTGQLFLERDLRNEIPDSTLATKFDTVSTIRATIRKKQKRIYRLKADMEIEDLQKKEKNLRQRRRQLEEEIRIRERQIGVIDLELSIGQRRLESLKRVLTGEVPYTEPSPLPPTPDFYGEKGSEAGAPPAEEAPAGGSPSP